MSVVRFRKINRTPDTLRRPARELTFMPSQCDEDFSGGSDVLSDEFEEEVEMTRANEALMDFLDERATEPATVSLRDLIRQFDDY